MNPIHVQLWATSLTVAAAAGTGGEPDDVRAGAVQPVRVVQPSPVQPRQRRP